MANIKYLSIDSLAQDDTNALFEAICKKITHLSALEVKRDMLKLSGDDKSLNKHKVNIAQLIQVILFYDIPLEFKVRYVPKEEAPKMVMPENTTGLVEDPTKKAIADQKKEVLAEGVSKETTVVAPAKEETEVKTEMLPPPFLD